MVIKIVTFLCNWVSKLYSEKNKKKFDRLALFLHSRILRNWFVFDGEKFSIGFGSYIRGGQYITVGNNFTARKSLRIEAIDSYLGERFAPKINIGENVSINDFCHIGAINEINIGNNVVIASRVFITDHFHGNSDADSLNIEVANRPLVSRGKVCIGDNVWIGEGCVILPGVSIGRNSVVGANAVVTKSFPENSVIAGVPAQLIVR